MSEPRHLLASFCNLEHRRPSGLLWIQTEPFDAVWVDCGSEELINSCTGLARNSKHFFLTGHRQGMTFVTVLSKKDFSFVSSFALPEVKDAHSLVWHNNRLYILSTGTDSVFSFDPYRADKTPKIEWRAGPDGNDSHHLSGLCVHEGQLLCCGFGRRVGASWTTAKHGFVRNLSTGVFLLQGLRQPHSIRSEGTDVFFCESATGTVRTLTSKVGGFKAFIRGFIQFPDGKHCVGFSSRRMHSKSTGRKNPGVQESTRGKCGITIFSSGRAAGAKFIDLSAFGDEIYDLIPLTSIPDAATIRRWKVGEGLFQRNLERSIDEARTWGQQLDAALTRARAAHAQQAKLVEERTAWAQKLNAQLKTAAEENKRLQAKLTGAKALPQVGQREILLHFHIFKNAGTTLDAALEKNLGPTWMQMEGDDPNVEMDWRKALKFIEAHPEARALSSHTLRYPPPPRLRGIKFIPLFLVRHPIDRLASIYYFERENAEGSHSETSRVAQSGSLAEFVRFTLTKRPEIGCDTQTAFIGRSGVYDAPPMIEHLEAAKTALEALPVPGVVERMDQYLAMLELAPAILPPNPDLARPDENRNPERAPTLLVRLRTIRGQLPPKLWHELCKRNRLDLELWRFAHRLTGAKFAKLPGAADRLADFRRRKGLANEAALQSKDLLKQTKRAWRSKDPAPSANGEQHGTHRAYALLKETADERLAWAQILEKELRNTQSEFEKLTKEYQERSAWAQSLDAELQQARAAFAEESKLVEERTAWARTLDADLEKARAALAEQTRLVDERTTWATALNADLEKARAALAQQTNLVEERSAWGQALSEELQLAQANFGKLTKEHAERTAWARTLDADLEKARAALAEQTRLVDERTIWAIALGADLEKARAALTKQSKLVDERTAWALALDTELNQARVALAQQTKLVEERSAWGRSLSGQLDSAQSSFAKLSQEHAERTAWAKKLEAEVQSARTALAEQTKVADDRTAWAKKLDAQLSATTKETTRLQGEHAKAVAWAKDLDADLNKARVALTQQSKLVEERSAWGKSLADELRTAQTNFAKLTKEHAERTAWAKDLGAELKSARSALAEQTKVAGERTTWAKKLDTELVKMRAAHAEQVRVVEERTAWAKTLDAELKSARLTLAQQVKLVEERSTWAKSLDADLNKARVALSQQATLVEERSAWGKSLADELRSAQINFSRLAAEHAERTAWAQSLDADLQKARAALAEQSKLVKERTVWAQTLDTELKHARAATPAALTQRVEELSTWGNSLDAELKKARESLTEQIRLVEERSTWAKSVEGKLHASQDELAELTQEYAERTAWAQSLDIDLQKARAALAAQTKLVEERTAWARALEADVSAARQNIEQLDRELTERTAWAKSLDGELHEARKVAAEREQLAQQTLGALAVLRRDLVAKNVEARATAGSLLDAELRAEAAEAEVRRLTATQAEALNQVNHVLRQAQLLQQFVNALDSARRATEEKLRQQTRELARYETRLLCRLAAKRPSRPALRLQP